MANMIIKPCENCGSGNFVELDNPGAVPVPQSSVDQLLVRIYTCNDCWMIRMFLHDPSEQS